MARPKTVETSEKLKASAVHIKDSAAQMERSTARVEDSADRRTELAADRTTSACAVLAICNRNSLGGVRPTPLESVRRQYSTRFANASSCIVCHRHSNHIATASSIRIYRIRYPIKAETIFAVRGASRGISLRLWGHRRMSSA